MEVKASLGARERRGRGPERAMAPTRRPNPSRDAALALLALGWSVVPVAARGKRPIVPWTVYQSRPPQASEIDTWFAGPRLLNVGVVTGAISNLIVIDVDAQHDGPRSLARLERELGKLPDAVEATTGGGGRHLYFAHPGGTLHNHVGIAPGIDVRGDGGCIVAPPSLHRSGKRYAWTPGHAPRQMRPAPLPARWLRPLQPPASASGHPPAHWRELVRDGVAAGARNSTLASLAGHLLHRGVDAQVVLELLLSWNRMRCRPPLDDAEVAGVVDSIARLHRQQSG